MVSRIKELEKLIIQGRKSPKLSGKGGVSVAEGIRRLLVSEGELTGVEKRQLRDLAKKARKNVDYYNIVRDLPELSLKVTEGNLSEPFDRKNIKPVKSKKPAKPKGESRADIKARVKGTPKSKSSVKDVAPLGGSSYEIKKGDTLSAIAKRKNTTVAALMRMNPKIKDKDKIRAGQFIKVGKPKTEAFRIKEKKRSGTTDPARTIAEAKRRGLTTYTPKGSNTPKAAVTAAELKKSGLSLRAYLNKMKKKKK